jgi:membrane protease YdiL (CAAX protease family)
MIERLLVSACAAALVAPLLALAAFMAGERRFGYVGLFYGVLLTYSVLVFLPGALGLEFLPRWNWMGKLLALLAAGVFLARGPIGAKEAGVTRAQRPGSLPLALLVMLVVLGLALPDSPVVPDGRTLLFQAVMPGLDEELIFRGIMLAALARAFPPTSVGLGRYVAWPVVVTTLLFGLLHAIRVQEGSVGIDFERLLPIAFIGYVLAWLRVHTGSLLLPVLMHNAANVVGAGGLAWLAVALGGGA